MLVCYHNQSILPEDDLVYLAFLFSLNETIADIEIYSDLNDDDVPCGFLAMVPFLHAVPLQVQVELLGETWSNHRHENQFQATLLDAAIVYAAFMTASRIIDDEPGLAADWLADNILKVNSRIIHRAPERLESLFDCWWDDRDFLMLDDFQDMPPEQAKSIRMMMRLPEAMIEPMFDVLERGRVLPNVGDKLKGLISPEEIQNVVLILLRSPGEARQVTDEIEEAEGDDDIDLYWGLEDRYHDVLVGPCNPETIEQETNCPIVSGVGVTGANDFDCTYVKWVTHLRDAVHRAVEQPDDTTDVSTDEKDIIQKVKQAIDDGFGDGIRIKFRELGWIIVDETNSYLTDIDYPVWGVGDVDEEMPPLYFDCAEDAYRAYKRSQISMKLLAERRKKALQQIKGLS